MTWVLPEQVLAEHRWDCRAVLVLWVLRRSVYVVLLLGTAAALGGGDFDPYVLSRLQQPLQMVRALFTPLAGVALAFSLQVVLDAVGLVLAVPRTGWVTQDPSMGEPTGPVMRWVDRFYVMRAYRAVRSSWAVRRLAVRRLGLPTWWLRAVNLALWVATGLAGVVFVVALWPTAQAAA